MYSAGHGHVGLYSRIVSDKVDIRATNGSRWLTSFAVRVTSLFELGEAQAICVSSDVTNAVVMG